MPFMHILLFLCTYYLCKESENEEDSIDQINNARHNFERR